MPSFRVTKSAALGSGTWGTVYPMESIVADVHANDQLLRGIDLAVDDLPVGDAYGVASRPSASRKRSDPCTVLKLQNELPNSGKSIPGTN